MVTSGVSWGYILSPTPILSFSGPQNHEINRGNEKIGGGLKQLEEIGDLLQIVSICTVKMKQMEKIGDFRHSSSIKGVKMKTINVNLLTKSVPPANVSILNPEN